MSDAERDPTYEELLAENKRLKRRVEELEKLVEEFARRGKRQAAPFSRDRLRPDPKTPGRKSGAAYGRHAHREPPPEVAAAETLAAPLPETCPRCGSGEGFEPAPDAVQFQTEIPRTPLIRKFVVKRGRCRRCGAKIQGRHPLQTSDALGAAASQFGAVAHAATTFLNKECGLSHGKVAKVFETLFGMTMTRGAACRSMLRTAKVGNAAYEGTLEDVRRSPEVVPDETGWRVGGKSAWLLVAAAADATAYRVDRHRGFDGMRLLIPPNYAGRMTHDGYGSYGRYAKADHQQCTTHLLRRCKELLETATRGAVRFPRALRELLQEGLAVRDRFRDGAIAATTTARRGRELKHRVFDLVWPIKSHAGNERLAKFVENHLEEIFAYLRRPGTPATNARAEQAIRPAVVNRKVWGGNRTWHGAAAQSILCSLLRTCWQRRIPAVEFLADLRQSTRPLLIPHPER